MCEHSPCSAQVTSSGHTHLPWVEIEPMSDGSLKLGSLFHVVRVIESLGLGSARRSDHREAAQGVPLRGWGWGRGWQERVAAG